MSRARLIASISTVLARAVLEDEVDQNIVRRYRRARATVPSVVIRAAFGKRFAKFDDAVLLRRILASSASAASRACLSSSGTVPPTVNGWPANDGGSSWAAAE